MLNPIKSTPFYYSKISQSSLNLNELSIYHTRHKVSQPDTFVTSLPKPPPLTQPHKHQRMINFTEEVQMPVRQQTSLPTIKTICKTEQTDDYSIQHHLHYLNHQQQHSINTLVKKLDHLDKVGEDVGKNILQQLEEFDNKKDKQNDDKKNKDNRTFKFRGGWAAEEKDNIREKLVTETDKDTALNSERNKQENSSMMPKIQKSQSNPGKASFNMSPILQRQLIKNRRRALVAKRLSFKMSFYRIEGDPVDVNRLQNIIHLFHTMHEDMTIICEEHKHAYHSIERLNGYGDLIRKFIFEKAGEVKFLRHSSGDQMFEDFLSQISLTKGENLQSKNLKDLVNEINDSQLFKRLIYFASSLKVFFQQKQEQKNEQKIEIKKQIQDKILQQLGHVSNQKDYELLVPNRMNLPKRSIQEQIVNLQAMHQPLAKFSEYELLKAQLMEVDEKEILQHRME